MPRQAYGVIAARFLESHPLGRFRRSLGLRYLNGVLYQKSPMTPKMKKPSRHRALLGFSQELRQVSDRVILCPIERTALRVNTTLRYFVVALGVDFVHHASELFAEDFEEVAGLAC